MTLCKIFSVLVMVAQVRSSRDFLQSSFSVRALCNFQERLRDGCFEEVRDTRDHLECFTKCAWDETCQGGLTLVSSRGCFHERVCTPTPTCVSPDQNVRYYNKVRDGALTTKLSFPQTSNMENTRPSTRYTTISSVVQTLVPKFTMTPSTSESSTLSSTTQASLQPALTSTPTKHSASILSTTVSVTSQPTSADSSRFTTTTDSGNDSTTAPMTSLTCENSGTPVTPKTCNCSATGGWVGALCQRRPYSCSELAEYGYSPVTKVYLIDVYRNKSYLAATPCELGSGNNQVGVLRHSDIYSMNRTYGEYVKGFFLNATNYWLGLDNMLAYNIIGLTNLGAQLNVLSANVRGTIINEYNGFQISDSSSGYSYTIGKQSNSIWNITGTADLGDFQLGDIFGPNEKTSFSAYDKDQDEESARHCASKAGAGWWFTTCSPLPTVKPLGTVHPVQPEERLILPKYDTTKKEPKVAFKSLYIYLVP